MDVEGVAEGIVAGVGGPANIRSVGHCTTRLRLVLADKALADRTAVRGLPGIMSTVERGGQFQVVIGHEVGDVDRRVRTLVAAAMDGREPSEADVPVRWRDQAFDLVTGTFHPLLYALVGSSMIKTILTVAVQLGWISTDSPTYAIWAAAGNAAFYFLPVLVGITASAKLGANPYLGGVIAAALLEANFTDLGPPGTRTSFLGIPVSMVDYGQSVVPAFIAAVSLSILERWLRRRLPKPLHMILVPTICLAVLVPATAIVFGPVGTTVANAVSDAVTWLWELSPAVAGALMGGLWQVFVIFGIHWGFVPVIVNDLSVQGYSLLTGPLVAAVLAQGAATLAVFLRTRNRGLRTLAGASAVSAFVAGVTEPAIYGVTLPLRRPFLYACAGGAVGGAIAAVGRSAADSFIFPGLVTLPAYLSVGSFTLQVTGTATAIVIAFGLTILLGFPDVPADPTPADALSAGATSLASAAGSTSPMPAGTAGTVPLVSPGTASEPAATARTGPPGGPRGPGARAGAGDAAGPGGPSVPERLPGPGGTPGPGDPATSPDPALVPPSTSAPAPATLTIGAPLTGAVVPLADVPDQVFARGLLGPGVGIRPSGAGLVRAPASGRITSIARARHALGITTDDGVDVMVHVGIDTVHLAGRHFDVLVARGQHVEAGQPIAHADLAGIGAEGYDRTTVVVVTNPAAHGPVEVAAAVEVSAGDPLLRVTLGIPR